MACFVKDVIGFSFRKNDFSQGHTNCLSYLYWIDNRKPIEDRDRHGYWIGNRKPIMDRDMDRDSRSGQFDF